MSRQTMETVRRRRKALGLVQANVWIREEDREAFQAAVAPFRKAARDIEQEAREEAVPFEDFTYRVRFPFAPPAAVRNTMKASGWLYDREGDVWRRRVSEQTVEALRGEAATLKVRYQASIDYEWG
ncbi:hypothetical protein [Asaia krungthepensis]|uniref:Phage protein n=1 Tax=Asaia krungthepensis NRIC 0535 TaxID=1307925 RepID=A0ABQ0Q150_9PROT|nr:hypothetical protein [Asaia krungthepensis]GBQ86596.1 hypothetical protein AA0535_1059 [Asaia krungthepensis NRIC 0535]